jgi:hypothetical protein
MDITWISLGLAGLYIIVFCSLTLSLAAVFYAFRLSRITGLFSAWTLLIAGLILTCFTYFAYFGSVIFEQYYEVRATVEGFTPGSFSLLVLILVCTPALFFGAMYQLHGMFKTQKESASESSQVENPPLAQ